MIIKKTKKGFTLVEVLVALAILVLLIVGITTGVNSATRAYQASTFESESATLAGIINTTLEDLLRYADADVAEASQAMGNLKITSEDYHLTLASFELSDDGFIRLKKPDGTSLDLVSFGAYPNLEVHTADSDPLVTFADGYYTVHYLITGLDDSSQSRDVEYRIRPANTAIQYTGGGGEGEEGGGGGGNTPVERRKVVLKLHYNDDTNTTRLFDRYAGDTFDLDAQDHRADYSKNGYSFEGWYKSRLHRASDAVSGTITLNGNLDLYAKWSSNSLTVTFQVKDPETGATMTETYSQARGSSFNPKMMDSHFARSGYTLSDWYTDKSMTVKASDTSSFTSDTTLYAKLTPVTYTVYFSGNGGSGTMAPQTFTYGKAQRLQPNAFSITYSVTCVTKDNGDLILKSRREFEGWDDGLGHHFEDGALITEALSNVDGGNVTLTARWSESYSAVELPADVYEKTYSVMGRDVYKKSLDCLGWYSDSDLKNLVGTPGEYYTPTGDITLHGKYGSAYRIDYVDDSGEGTLDRTFEFVEDGDKTKLPGGTRPGYTLLEWRWYSITGAPAGKPDDYFPSKSSDRYSDCELHAYWQVNSYTLTYDGNGLFTPNPASKSINYGATYGTLPTTTVQTGYDLKWYTEKTGGTEVTATSLYLTDGNQTIYARQVPRVISLSFDSDGGSTVNPAWKSITYGGSYGTLPVPIKAGYEFGGWYTEKDGGGTEVKADDIVKVTSNLTVYAYWRARPSTVTFDPNDGALPEGAASTKEVRYNEAYGTMPTPTRKSYSFDGWYTEKENGTKVESATIVTTAKDHTLYAHWKPYQVWFRHYDKGSDKLAVDYPITALPDISKSGYVADGYQFMGWFSTETPDKSDVYDANKIDWINKKVEELTGQNAHFPVTAYWVRFDGGAVKCTSSVVLTAEHKATLVLPTQPATDADGFRFVGWSDGSASYAGGSTFTFTKWQHDFKSCWLKLDADGGNTSPAKISGGKAELPKPSKTGYTFQNWSDGKNTYAAGESVALVGKVTLKAVWTPNTYTIAFNGNGSTSGSTASKTGCKYDTDVTLTANGFKKTGYSFTGWNTKANGTGTSYTDKQSVKNLASENGVTVTLYAQWSANTYTIKFDKNGASAVGSMDNLSATYDIPLNLTACSFTRTGYVFDGWATSATGGKAYTDMQSVKNLTGDPNGIVTLYAVWIPNTYTIAFDGNSGSGSMSSITGCKYDTDVTLTVNSFKKTGYRFTGWNTKADGTGTAYTDKQSVKNLASENGVTVTLYAQWTGCKVSYNANGGSVSPESATYSGTALTLPTPTRTGYNFNGWFTAASGGTKVGNAGATYTPTADITLYAQWTGCKVSYNANGGSVSPESATYSGSALTLLTPTRTGYKFDGWFTAASGGTKIGDAGAAYTPTADITMYAHWTANTATVTFSTSRGSVSPSTLTVTYDSTYGTLPTPTTKDHYDFKGWYLSSDFSGSPVTADTKVTTAGNHTLYAKWEIKTYTLNIGLLNASLHVWYDGFDQTFTGSTTVKIPYGTDVTFTFAYSTSANTQAAAFSGDCKLTYTGGMGRTMDAEASALEPTNSFGGKAREHYFTMPDSDVTFTAISIDCYTVTVNSTTGGSVSTSKVSTVPVGTELTVNSDGSLNVYATTVTATTNNGYTFVGWSVGGKTLATTSDKYTVTGNTTVTATWKANQYTVAFNANGGTCATESKTVTYASAYGDLPTPTRDGYTFAGWYLGDAKITSTTTVATAGNHTLTAKWLKNYTVTLNAARTCEIISSPSTITNKTETVLSNVPDGTQITLKKVQNGQYSVNLNNSETGYSQSVTFERTKIAKSFTKWQIDDTTRDDNYKHTLSADTKVSLYWAK